MRVKVCGLKLMRDLRLAEAAGAAYVGFIVEADSPRALSAEAAVLLARAARARPVYVVVGSSRERLHALVAAQQPAALQLHWDIAPEAIADLREGLPETVELWRVIGLPPEAREAAVSDALAIAGEAGEAGAARILLDTEILGRSGGTGVRLSPKTAALFVQQCSLPCLLAGGLAPEDLSELEALVKPWAFDLSSKLEKSPGVKDVRRMRELAHVIRAAGSQE